MNQSPQFQRAMVLQEHGRHELAEKELRRHLGNNPADGLAHAALSISLTELGRRDEAEQAAREGIGLAPDLSYAHFALARLLTNRNRHKEAEIAIKEAIRLDPTDADFHGMNAAILLESKRWADSLAAAETGLQFDPQHVISNNIRAMALVKLGRKTEAGQTINATLARDPGNSLSHANKGWTLLEQGKRKEAMTHFRESLRIDPGNEWARLGLVESIKAGNPVYAVMLKYFLWSQKLSSRAQWGIFMGGYFGNRLLGGLSRSHPEWAMWITPLQILYITFAILTWLAHPIFNLMLFMHPFGRHSLNEDQRLQAKLVGSCLGLALLCLVLNFIGKSGGDYLIPAAVSGLLAIPVSAVFNCAKGWPRNSMIAISLALAAAGLIAAVIFHLNPPKRSAAGSLGMGALSFFLVGIFASQWIAAWLSTQRPKR